MKGMADEIREGGCDGGCDGDGGENEQELLNKAITMSQEASSITNSGGAGGASSQRNAMSLISKSAGGGMYGIFILFVPLKTHARFLL